MPSSTASDRAADFSLASESSDTPALRRLLARLDLTSGDVVVALAARAVELISVLAQVLSEQRYLPHCLHLITSNLRQAEAARRLPIARAGRVAVHAGHAIRAAPVTPSVVLLWPSGWEGASSLAQCLVEAAVQLSVGGWVYALARRSKEAASLRRDMRAVFGNEEVVARYRDLVLMRAERTSKVGRPSTPRNLVRPIVEAEVLGRYFSFETAPSVFSHRRLDDGTRLLVKLVAKEPLQGVHTILDLGCGYGAIGVVLAALLPEAQVVLGDVDTRAVELAKRNTARNGVADRTHALLSDGLRHLGQRRFDLVVSHFPLHITAQERARLLRECREGLAEDGVLYLCGLASYDLRRSLGETFAHWWTAAEVSAGSGGAAYRILGARKAARPPPRHRRLRAVLAVRACKCPALLVARCRFDRDARAAYAVASRRCAPNHSSVSCHAAVAAASV